MYGKTLTKTVNEWILLFEKNAHFLESVDIKTIATHKRIYEISFVYYSKLL